VDPLDANVVCGVATGAVFTVYARSDLSMGGLPVAERVAGARDLLLAGEQKAVESALWALMVAELATMAPDPDATAGSITEAIAMAEQLMAASYGGTPVIHLSRYAATLAIADSAARVDGGRLRSALGSDVVAGGGYGGAAPTTPGAAIDVIATGAVVYVRSDVLTFDEARNPRTNQIDSMAMRTYAIGWDCTAVRVNIPAAP